MRNVPGAIDSPDPERREFFSFAALFKNHFSIDWLVALLGKKASEILLFLEDGVEKGWLAKKEGGTYVFKDVRVREELEGRLPPHEKEFIHRSIAEYLIGELPSNGEGLLPLSHHLQNIHCDGKLCKLLLDAGDMYLRSFQTGEALKCYAKILNDLLNRADGENDELFIKAAIRYSKYTMTPVQDHLTVVSILENALKRACDKEKESYHACLYVHLAINEWVGSQYDKALEHFEKGWGLASKLDQTDIMRSAQSFAIYFSFWKGRYLEGTLNYEKFVPDIQIYPERRFPLLATVIAGLCYAMIGQITQGIGMLDAIRAQCQKKGDAFMSVNAMHCIGSILLDMGKTDEALDLLETWIKRAQEENNDWVWIWGELTLAVGYNRKGDDKQAAHHLKRHLEARKRVQFNIRFSPYILELCFAIQNKKLTPVAGLSLEEEIEACIAGNNVFLKGVAYRYKALLLTQEGSPTKKIIQLLNKSITFLTESGHQSELAMSQFEVARQYDLSGNKAKAREMATIGSGILALINEKLIPADIRNISSETPQRGGLLGEILKMGQEIVTIRDNKELVHYIISKANQITGAERGAIFLLDDASPSDLHLRASKNLTSDQINEPAFASAREMMREAVKKRKGIIQEADNGNKNGDRNGTMQYRICVPMILRNKVVGVLYNDNNLLKSSFQEEDLDTLSYFAAQAAIALENAIYYEEIQHLNQKLREENLYYEEQQVRSRHFEDIIGESSAIGNVLKKIEQVAATDSTVLIFGETGVGKEIVARAIHRYSPRHTNKFIRVFCNALPDTLIPSELFGHEKGAFTGASQRRIGRFELADGGTVFLDEIGDLNLDIQTRLLIVLQSKEFERVGGTESIHSDFRLVVATNRNLEEEVKANRFRSDLYYRIHVFPIYIPALRERKEDIPLLAQHFLKAYAHKMGKAFHGISKEDMNKLMVYEWPGNIRELENVIERGVILSNGPNFRVPELETAHLMPIHEKQSAATLKMIESEHILKILQETGWRIRGPGGAAEILDMKPTTLEFRMKKLGIQRQRYQYHVT